MLQSVVENETIADVLIKTSHDAFTQWSADDVDHNVTSLDGTGILHAMGIIASSTGGDIDLGQESSYRVKQQQHKLVEEVIKNKYIAIHQYVPAEKLVLSKVYFRSILELQSQAWIYCRILHYLFTTVAVQVGQSS